MTVIVFSFFVFPLWTLQTFDFIDWLYFPVLISSTSKIKVEFAGMTPPTA